MLRFQTAGGEREFRGRLARPATPRSMDLVILCLLSWLWTPGAAPPRGLGCAGDLPTETRVRDLPSRARSCAECGAQPGPPASASDLKVNLSQAAWGKGSPPSPADNQASWDFILVAIALSVAALALIIYCCFHQKCHPWILSCLHPSWQGWMDNHRHLPRTTVNSLQRNGASASGNPQHFPVAERSCNIRFVPSVLHREAFVHFRRPTVSKDGSTPLSAAAPGGGAGCGPTLETVLEMEDEL